MNTELSKAYAMALAAGETAGSNGDLVTALKHLERAHILSQRHTFAHVRVHWRMLQVGLRRRAPREVVGQMLRMVAALLFSQIWVPAGNTGGTDVSAFKPMPVPEDLRRLLAEDKGSGGVGAFIPLVLFTAVAVFLGVGLTLEPRKVPSPFVGRAAPALEGARLEAPESRFASTGLAGKVWLINFWASWCPPCREEHPLLVDLAAATRVPIVGVNYKDDPVRANAWLKQLGDPYVASIVDPEGRIGIEFGVYGMPETFVVDRKGIVRFKHIGALKREQVDAELLPLLRKLNAE